MLQDPWAGLMQQYSQQAAEQQSELPADVSHDSAHTAAGHSMSEVFNAAAEVHAVALNVLTAVLSLTSPVIAQILQSCRGPAHISQVSIGDQVGQELLLKRCIVCV